MTKKRETKKANIMIPLSFCFLFTAICVTTFASSISFNEAYTSYISRGNIQQIFNLTGDGFESPFFHIIIKFWSILFGTNIISMRFFSLLFAAVSLILLFQIVRKNFSVKIATASTAIAIIIPPFIYVAQSISSVTLSIALAIAATYFFQLTVESKSKKYGLVYSFITVFAALINCFSLILLALHFSTLVLYKTSKQKYQARVSLFEAIIFCLAICLLPMLNNRFNNEDDIQETMTELSVFAEGEEVIVSDAKLFYGAFFYENDNLPSIIIAGDCLEIEDKFLRPIKEIKIGVGETIKNYEKSHRSYWYLTNMDESKQLSELTPETDWFIGTQMITGKHAAFRLEKN